MINEVERAFELYGKRLYAYMRRLGLSEVEAETECKKYSSEPCVPA